MPIFAYVCTFEGLGDGKAKTPRCPYYSTSNRYRMLDSQSSTFSGRMAFSVDFSATAPGCCFRRFEKLFVLFQQDKPRWRVSWVISLSEGTRCQLKAGAA